MRSKLLMVLALAPMLAAAAEPVPEGRWQGVIEIPGRPLRMTLDLAPDTSGQWHGSVTVPALGLAGVSVKDVVVTSAGVSFALTGAFDSSRFGTARVEARFDSSAALAG
jgi:hypothetical protein